MRAKIQNHRQTWVTEGHFAYMYEHGINAVRIPVGYWVMASTTWQVRDARCQSASHAPAFVMAVADLILYCVPAHLV